jgi:Flp pilus assembly pilin Flp
MIDIYRHSPWSHEEGQDVAEYAIMMAVVLVIVVGTVRLIAANADHVFSGVTSSISRF